MDENAIGAVLHSVPDGIIAAALEGIQRAIAKKTVLIFQMMAWIEFAGSIRKVLKAFRHAGPTLRTREELPSRFF